MCRRHWATLRTSHRRRRKYHRPPSSYPSQSSMTLHWTGKVARQAPITSRGSSTPSQTATWYFPRPVRCGHYLVSGNRRDSVTPHPREHFSQVSSGSASCSQEGEASKFDWYGTALVVNIQFSVEPDRKDLEELRMQILVPIPDGRSLRILINSPQKHIQGLGRKGNSPNNVLMALHPAPDHDVRSLPDANHVQILDGRGPGSYCVQNHSDLSHGHLSRSHGGYGQFVPSRQRASGFILYKVAQPHRLTADVLRDSA